MLVQEQFHSISEWEKHHREYHQEWKPWNPPTSTRKLRNRKRIKGLNLAKPNSLQSTTMVGIFLTAVFVLPTDLKVFMCTPVCGNTLLV